MNPIFQMDRKFWLNCIIDKMFFVTVLEMILGNIEKNVKFLSYGV